MSVTFELYHGQGVAPYIDDLARLRISVFRDFPYLYDGEMAYEANYIATYARSPKSLFVLARDGDQVVGVSTGLPMCDETPEFQAPFKAFDFNPDRIFYFGESVLLREYRGQGLGVRFFDEREAYARRLGGFEFCCFCAVVRPQDHPLRPHDYQPLDQFWQKRGFMHQPELQTEFSWRDIGKTKESLKLMSYWMKELK